MKTRHGVLGHRQGVSSRLRPCRLPAGGLPPASVQISSASMPRTENQEATVYVGNLDAQVPSRLLCWMQQHGSMQC